MRLTVLGSAASYAGPGQACAGYLIESATTRVVFDFGNGALANLAKVADPESLDAVFITHGHPDHFLDVYALQSLLRYAPEGPAAPLALHVPDGLFERMQLLLSERGAREFAEAFVCRAIEPGEPVVVGDIAVTPVRVPHTDPTFALVAECDGARLVYTADTQAGTAVLTAARGAGLLLAEATLPEAYAGAAPHMTASEAGRLAAEAGARSLVLTHVWPTNDRERMRDAASAEYAGPVSIATELETYDIPSGGTTP